MRHSISAMILVGGYPLCALMAMVAIAGTINGEADLVAVALIILVICGTLMKFIQSKDPMPIRNLRFKIGPIVATSILIVCYPLCVLMTISTVMGVVRNDGTHVGVALLIFVTCGALIKFIRWRDLVAIQKFHRELEELVGLDKCPIPQRQLCELFEYLDQATTPCVHRLQDCFDFLQRRGLETERTLKWFQANGAKCDCEAILNTASRFGELVGFEFSVPNTDPQRPSSSGSTETS